MFTALIIAVILTVGAVAIIYIYSKMDMRRYLDDATVEALEAERDLYRDRLSDSKDDYSKLRLEYEALEQGRVEQEENFGAEILDRDDTISALENSRSHLKAQITELEASRDYLADLVERLKDAALPDLETLHKTTQEVQGELRLGGLDELVEDMVEDTRQDLASENIIVEVPEEIKQLASVTPIHTPCSAPDNPHHSLGKVYVGGEEVEMTLKEVVLGRKSAFDQL